MRNIVCISHPTKKVSGTFALPGSKSESNRALILNKLAGNSSKIENISPSEDTQTLIKLLARPIKTLDVKDAGTNMRFLTAYYCTINKNKIITGSQRMQQRPIGKLVDALREIGFKIHFVKEEGFPPVEIIPTERVHLKYEITVDASESSQFISALVMISPVFPDGLTIKLVNKIVSKPYIVMTLKMMKLFGVSHQWNKNEIRIDHQPYRPIAYAVESDWSAASYWYSIAALSEEAEIILEGLKEQSMQGDKIIADLMKAFGVSTEYLTNGIKIKKENNALAGEMTFDFTDYPDLAQTIIVLAAAKNIRLHVKGLSTLRNKETDRIAALQSELKKAGSDLIQHKEDSFELIPGFRFPSDVIETYNDHRMAMAFAPLGILNEIKIQEPSVVKKSYPDFWNQLKLAGFSM